MNKNQTGENKMDRLLDTKVYKLATQTMKSNKQGYGLKRVWIEMSMLTARQSRIRRGSSDATPRKGLTAKRGNKN